MNENLIKENLLSRLASYAETQENDHIDEELQYVDHPNETVLWDAYMVQKILGESKRSPAERFRQLGISVDDNGFYTEKPTEKNEEEAEDFEDLNLKFPQF